MPGSELKRQRKAFLSGVLRATVLVAIIAVPSVSALLQSKRLAAARKTIELSKDLLAAADLGRYISNMSANSGLARRDDASAIESSLASTFSFFDDRKRFGWRYWLKQIQGQERNSPLMKVRQR